jgi:hypothetical protein
MSTAADFEDRQVDLLATLQTEARERFDRELEDVRAATVACYEQAVGRLREARWVPLDAVSRLFDDLSTVVDLERARATRLAADLEEAKRDLDSARQDLETARAQCQAAVNAAKEAAARERDELEARLASQLNAARDRAESSSAAEAQAREELAAVRLQSQEIVDAQMLRLIEFRRQLDDASVQDEQASADDVTVAPIGHDPSSSPEPTTVTKMTPRTEARQNEAPEFSAIEAVLAGNPPVGAWQKARA